MNSTIKNRVGEYMTKNTITVPPNMIMTKVSKIFDENTFHHLPVVDSHEVCVGIISKSDYYQLQNNFTRMEIGSATINNDRFFKTLIVSEVMTPNPISIDINESTLKVIDIFLENKYHSIVVTNKGKYAGIITPYDILKHYKVNTHE